MSTRHIVALGGLLVAGALGACSSTPLAPAQTSTVTATQTVTSTITQTVTAAPTTTSPASPLALGATYSTAGVQGDSPVSYTVSQWRDSVTVAGRTAQSGAHFGAILASFCNHMSKTTMVGWSPWSVQTADGQNFRASSEHYEGDPLPGYPFEQAVAPGLCVKGWIVAEVSNGATVATATVGSDAVPPARWTLQ